jgi:tetratricopeptide (TPR) repeat protein
MVSRPLAKLLLAGLTPAIALFGQTGNALLDGSKTAANAPPQLAVPREPLTPEMSGDIYLAKRMYREAIDAFREGSPKDPVLHNKMGIAYHQLLQLDRARKEYETAVKLRPDYEEAINNIGTIYYAQKSYRRATTWFTRAVKVAPEDEKSAAVYVNLGSAWFSRKNYERAQQYFQIAVKLDPEVLERHSSFGVMMQERNVEERAKYHFYLARLYAKSGRTDLALQYLRKALEEGFREKDKVASAPEFSPIKNLPEFQALLKLEPRVL